MKILVKKIDFFSKFKWNRVEESSFVNVTHHSNYPNTPPYTPGTSVLSMETVAPISNNFVRVFRDSGTSETTGKWIVLYEDILLSNGNLMSPMAIKSKFALPFTPTDLVDVNIIKGAKLRYGQVGPNFGEPGGGNQFELLKIEDAQFLNKRAL